MSGPKANAAPGGDEGAVHHAELVPGMSRPEFIRLLEAVVPAEARFAAADGDVDVTLRWESGDLKHLDRLIAQEAAVWRAWREAESRERDFARLHQHACVIARQAYDAWHVAASELARRHPTIEDLAG